MIVGTGPAGATAADVLTGAGWSVIMLEKGRNHLLALDPPFARARARVERRDQVLPPPLPRTRSVPRAAHLPARRSRRRPHLRGRGQQPAVDRRRRRLPRRRQAPTLSRGRLPRRSRSSGRSTAPTSSTGPSTTTRWSRTTPRRSASSAWPGRRVRTRSRSGAVGRVSDAARRRHVRRGAHHRSGDPARLPPVPGADRRELGAVRRPARVQQLRVLRALRLPDRSQGRPGRAAAQRAAYRPLRDPPGVVSSNASLLDANGRTARGVRYLDADGDDARGDRRASWSSRAARGRPPAAAAIRDRELVRSRRPLPHVPLPDVRDRHVPVPPARSPRPVGHAPPRRPHDRRRRRARVRPRARTPLLPFRHRRARRRRRSDHRSAVHPPG